MAATHVSNASAILEFLVDAIQRRYPATDEISRITRAEKTFSAVKQRCVVFMPAEALPRFERFHHFGYGLELGHRDFKRAGNESRAAFHCQRKGLLLHEGLWASFEGPIPASARTEDFVDFCAEHYRAVWPVSRWLLGVMPRGAKKP